MHSDTLAAEEIRTLTFDDLPLAPFLKETIKAIGYTTPTPIQAEAIPLVVEGRNEREGGQGSHSRSYP
jgi:superfamily II DNA/RNA helicase